MDPQPHLFWVNESLI